MKTLKDLYFHQLNDAYDAECRLAKALEEWIDVCTCEPLGMLLQSHQVDTESHIVSVELAMMQAFNEPAKHEKCAAMVGLIKEAQSLIHEFKDTPVIHAALVAVLQKIEHYEIATYGCLQEWAGLLGDFKAVTLFGTILEQEKAANASLTSIANAYCNPEAIKEFLENQKAEDISDATKLRTGKATSVALN